MFIDKHPYYDQAYRFLEENHTLRFHLARDSMPEDELPKHGVTRRLKKKRNETNSIFFLERPELKSNDYILKEGSISHNSILNIQRQNHPSHKNAIYRVPLLMKHIEYLIYYLQLINDPMHIISNAIDAILLALKGTNMGPFKL